MAKKQNKPENSLDFTSLQPPCQSQGKGKRNACAQPLAFLWGLSAEETPKVLGAPPSPCRSQAQPCCSPPEEQICQGDGGMAGLCRG